MGYRSNVSIIVGKKLREAIHTYIETEEPDNKILKDFIALEEANATKTRFRYHADYIKWYTEWFECFENWLTSHKWAPDDYDGDGEISDDEEWGYSFIRIGEDRADIDEYGNSEWQWVNCTIDYGYDF